MAMRPKITPAMAVTNLEATPDITSTPEFWAATHMGRALNRVENTPPRASPRTDAFKVSLVGRPSSVAVTTPVVLPEFSMMVAIWMINTVITAPRFTVIPKLRGLGTATQAALPTWEKSTIPVTEQNT